MKEKIGIDLGYAKIAVTKVGDERIHSEPAVVALCPDDGSFLGIGGDADRYKPEKGEQVTLRRIFREGIVVPEYTRAAIARLISRYGTTTEDGCRLLLSVPCSFGDVEEGALSEMAIEAGADEVYLVYSPIAALAGNGIDLGRSAIIVDVGATRTDILTVCHGRIFHKKTYTSAGEGFDLAVAGYLLDKHKVKVSPEVAEQVKIKIGTVWVGNERRCIDVRGRDATNGDYCTVRLSSEEMFTAFEEPMASLIEGVCDAITKIPTDCVQEVFDTGILLAGGGSMLDGLDKMISGVTGVTTTRLADPATTVARGLAELLDSVRDPRAAGTRNISRYIMKMAATPQREEKQ